MYHEITIVGIGNPGTPIIDLKRQYYTVCRGITEAIVKPVSAIDVMMRLISVPLVFTHKELAQKWCERFNEAQIKAGKTLSLVNPPSNLLEGF